MWIPMHPLKRQLILGFTIIGLITLAILFFVKNKIHAFDFPAVPNTGGKSLEEIRMAGEPKYCTFNSKASHSKHGQFFTFNGLVYVSMYGENKQEVVFFIDNQQEVYMWRSGDSVGSVYDSGESTVYKNKSVEIDLSEVVNGICVKKHIDPTQFLLPPGISFKEI
jgi:hypothetical protein